MQLLLGGLILLCKDIQSPPLLHVSAQSPNMSKVCSLSDPTEQTGHTNGSMTTGKPHSVLQGGMPVGPARYLLVHWVVHVRMPSHVGAFTRLHVMVKTGLFAAYVPD